MERTVVLIKPDGVKRGLVGEVLSRFEKMGLKIVAMKMVQADFEVLGKHYKDDEEYFYHSLYPLVANNNSDMAKTIFEDFVRRSSRPQTPAMLRDIFSSASQTSSGGITLPAGKVEFIVALARIQRIAGKIARGVIFLRTQEYCPESNIVDMRICETVSEVPEMYQLSSQAASMETPYQKVFSSTCFSIDGHHIVSLVFWEAFMFGVTVQDNK